MAEADANIVNAASLKLPQLWIQDVDGWFLHIESQFVLRGITAEATKFHYVVASLDSSVSSKVRSILRQPPSYSALKTALLSKYSLTLFERAAQIRAISSLGGRKPSEVMDEMLLLLGDNESDILFLHHFVSILPGYVRNVLSSSQERDPGKLAAEADCIFISGRPEQPIASVYEDKEQGTSVDHVSRQQRKQSSSSSQFNKKSTANPPGLCYYHRIFGARALKCSRPCTWQSGNDNGDRQ